MDDTPFTDDSCDVDAFGAVVFDGNGDGDDIEDCAITDDGDFSDVDSFGSDDDIEDQHEHEHEHEQQQMASKQNNGRGRSPSTSSIHAQQRKRSEYEARRCKSVDIMTERLMIHADDYYQNNKRTRRLSKAFWCGCLALAVGVLATTGAILALETHLQLGQQQPRDDKGAVEADINAGNLPSSQSTTQSRPNDVYENANAAAMVNVPCANQHTLRFDGVLFVTKSSDGEAEATHDDFDSYAKTLDPITELHFAPGESNTTKRIVLTTTQPDLLVNNGIHQNTTEMMDSDQGLVLSIDLEANGEVWLPQATGQRIPSLDQYGTNHHHHLAQSITKNIYGPGDRFVLAITDDSISLFRNDHNELVGMWMNPSNTRSQDQPMYAQIWFKDTKSSMVATAWHEGSAR
jgi:hypothetical protein